MNTSQQRAKNPLKTRATTMTYTGKTEFPVVSGSFQLPVGSPHHVVARLLLEIHKPGTSLREKPVSFRKVRIMNYLGKAKGGLVAAVAAVR